METAATPFDELVALIAATVRAPLPSIVGLTGSVAVGKSHLAAELAAALADREVVAAVVSTDGFLRSNVELGQLGLGLRKGFPESFDRAALAAFLEATSRGDDVEVPTYDHFAYDVLGATTTLGRPDLVLVEGLCLLGPGAKVDGVPIADRVRLTIYLDAPDHLLFNWYRARFVANARRAVEEPGGFWDLFAAASSEELDQAAAATWELINAVNLLEHIAPGRATADVVASKDADHRIARVVTNPPADRGNSP